MISYFDEIQGIGDTFPGFPERKGELNEALIEISESVGDTSHVAGSPDYIVRITTAKWVSEPLKARNAFVIADHVDHIAIFEKVYDEPLQQIASLTAQDDWFDDICDEFSGFRERIDE